MIALTNLIALIALTIFIALTVPPPGGGGDVTRRRWRRRRGPGSRRPAAPTARGHGREPAESRAGDVSGMLRRIRRRTLAAAGAVVVAGERSAQGTSSEQSAEADGTRSASLAPAVAPPRKRMRRREHAGETHKGESRATAPPLPRPAGRGELYEM